MSRSRPIRFKELGEFLVRQREGRGWKQTEAALHAKNRGLKALTRQVLLRLEAGQIKSPDPEALRAVAALYTLNYDDLISRLMAERYGVGRDLSWQGSTGQQDSHLLKGGADVPAEARVRELQARVEKAEQERDAYKGIVDNASGIVAELSTVIRGEGRTATRDQTTRRRRDRKAG